MRAVALLAAVVLVASCSQQPAPPALPVASPPEAGHKAPPVLAPTDAPAPAASIGIVPTIDYPLGTGAGTAGDGSKPTAAPSGAPANPAGGDPSLGTSPPPSAAPIASPVPSPAAGDLRVLLDHQPVTLPGGVANLSTAANPQVLVYQYGTDPSRLSADAPGCLRIGIKLDTTKRDDWKGVNIVAATVMYAQYDNGSRTTWLGNYVPGSASSQLSLDASATGGVLTFQVKGMLVSDGGGSFGIGGGGPSQIFMDWTMKNLATALPPSPSPDPSASASPGAAPSSSADGDFWSNLNSLRR